jgi:hypothetical protein
MLEILSQTESNPKHFFKEKKSTAGTTLPTMQCHTLNNVNHQQHHCQNLNSHIQKQFHSREHKSRIHSLSYKNDHVTLLLILKITNKKLE